MEKVKQFSSNDELDLQLAHTFSTKQVVDFLQTDVQNGLNSDEVATRREKYGKNEIKQKKKMNIVLRFFKQFSDLLILILLFAAILSFVALFLTKSKDAAEWAEPFIILFITLVNAGISTYQEVKADRAVESLRKMTMNTTRVIRNGEVITLPSDRLVVGDIIFLEAGDNVYADARIIDGNHLRVIESSLTGEYAPVDKDEKKIWNVNTPLGDRTNMLYSGTTIANGSVTAIVTATGMDSEIGKIAKMTQDVKPEKTPLQKQLMKFSKIVTIICAVICVLALGIEFIQVSIDHVWNNADAIIEAIMVAVSLAVAAVPEGLPIVITVNMAMGMERMAKENAIVKNLASVEVLGSTSVICTDKTGTLTQNKMIMSRMYDFLHDEMLTRSDTLSSHQKWMLSLGALCCNASINFDQKSETSAQGDSTELAILRACIKTSKDNELYKAQLKTRIEELPFDSDRKLMTTIYKVKKQYLVITKGANEMLLPVCNMSSKNLNKCNRLSNEMAAQGVRTLGIAYKYIKKLPKKITIEDMEKDLKYLGFFAMIDPVRSSAKSTIKNCKDSGIKVVMITGDHILTAQNIARSLGLFDRPQAIAITGSELEAMTDEEFAKKLPDIVVYARVTPKDKLRIAQAWKDTGNVVAMIGDGVNDAPALKVANIGCAMGNSTDVSKEASDMILQDNNFQTIVHAVKQGRSIFSNILKVINYLVATNLAEVIVIVSLIIFDLCIDWGEVVTFSSLQILWINLLGDSLPAITLGQEPPDPDIMSFPPRNVKDSIFAHGLFKKIVGEAIVHSVIGLIGFFICFGMAKGYHFSLHGYTNNEAAIHAGSTGLFMIMGVSQMVQVLNLKSDESFFKTDFGDNKQLLMAVGISLLLIFLVVFTPEVCETFNMVLFYSDWRMSMGYIYVFVLALFIPIIYMEICKIFERRKHTNQAVEALRK